MDRDEFVSVVSARVLGWRRIAFFICGDWNRAEDLLQQALLRMYVRWNRIEPAAVDAYARTVITRLAIDDARRPHRRHEISGEPPERELIGPSVEDALVVRDALQTLPRGQRAAVVLRYYQGLSVAETATTLGVSTGAVKSQTARGLAALRTALTPAGSSDRSGVDAAFMIREPVIEVRET